MADEPLSVTVEGTSIVVSMPGTSFRTAFFKASDEPRLMQSPAMSVEKEAPAQTRKEFEALSWEAAEDCSASIFWSQRIDGKIVCLPAIIRKLIGCRHQRAESASFRSSRIHWVYRKVVRVSSKLATAPTVLVFYKTPRVFDDLTLERF